MCQIVVPGWYPNFSRLVSSRLDVDNQNSQIRLGGLGNARIRGSSSLKKHIVLIGCHKLQGFGWVSAFVRISRQLSDATESESNIDFK